METVEKIVSSIIKFLKSTNQLDLLPQIINLLEKQAQRLAGENTAVVTSAYPLSSEELGEIEKQLFTLFKRKLEIINKIDNQVIGGFVVQVSDKIIDLSLDNYLSSIEEKLKNEKN